MSSHCNNHCYTTIFRGAVHTVICNGTYVIMCRTLSASKLQVAFLFCAGMLIVVTSSLESKMLKLNACTIPRSELVE